MVIAAAARRAAAKGKRNISTGFVSWSDQDLGRAQEAGAAYARINLRWASITPRAPRTPASPADRAYNFTGLDAKVTAAKAHGLKPILTIYDAPQWAEGENRPHQLEAGVWKPDPAAFGAFTHALAMRYSGSFRVGGRPLPVVRGYEIWNEPNLAVYLAPQWKRGKPYSPTLYAKLLNAAYRRSSRSHEEQGDRRRHGPARHQHGARRWRRPVPAEPVLRQRRAALAPKPHLNVLSHHPIYRGEVAVHP